MMKLECHKISKLLNHLTVSKFVTGTVTVEVTDDANKRNEKLVLKNNALFRSCISKIRNTFTDHAEHLDVVIPMYNLLEYNNNYSMASGSLWNHYRDEVIEDANENNEAGNCSINNNKTTTSKSFEFKTKIIGSTPGDNNTLEQKLMFH